MDQKLWPLIQNTVQAIAPHYQQATRAALAEAGFEGSDWLVTFMAYGLHPQPLTAEFWASQSPYGSQQRTRQRLVDCAGRGFLEETGESTYQLTERGRNAITGFFSVAGQALSPVAPLPAAGMDRLAHLLQRVVDSIAASFEPAEKHQFYLSRRTDPGPSAAAMTRIDQYATDLVRYRDDAHVAAWRPLSVSGQAWELLTFLWRGEAKNAAEMVEKGPDRGHTAESYAAALEQLIERGWVEPAEEDAYQLTEAGRQVREQAEADTDRLFFGPWAVLTEDEQQTLSDLLEKLKTGLAQIQEPAPA